MSAENECFVCGFTLRGRGKPRAEVTHGSGVGPTRCFCLRCWFKVRVVLEAYMSEEGLSYVVEVKYSRVETEGEEG